MMFVADRLNMSVKELAKNCTAQEISDWIAFYKIKDGYKQPKPKLTRENNPGPDPKKVRSVMSGIFARIKARKENHGG